MALVLLSYFGTMVTVFATLMFLLTNVFGSISVHQHRAEPHRMSAAARAMVAERYAAADARRTEVAQAELARAKVAVSIPAPLQKATAESGSDRGTQTALKQAQKAKLVRIARNEKHNERLAERHRDQDYATLALGYASDPREQLEAAHIFNTIGSIRTAR
jgi:hypothetical protein